MDPRQASLFNLSEFFNTLASKGPCPRIGGYPLDPRGLQFEVVQYLEQMRGWQEKAIPKYELPI